MNERAFRVTLGYALGMLIIQFLLGMAVNLFVNIPPITQERTRPNISAVW